MPHADRTWDLILGAAALSATLQDHAKQQAFRADDDGQLQPLLGDWVDADLLWDPQRGWESQLPPDDPRAALLDLYLPICSATETRPIAVGHLGQSLDGFIAMHSGESQFVTGDDNLVHIHRMRALCDVVVVGAGTVAADNPQLTTRLASGPNPLRVIFDPTRRLTADYRVFTDTAADTIYVCGRSRVTGGETHVGRAAIVGFDDSSPQRDVTQVLALLRGRGCGRVFVEGGGVTVSAFLEANLLDRLHIAIAPVFIGDGRPAIRLAPHASLRDCRRPAYRVFRMGGDVLFDCEVNTHVQPPDTTAESVERII